MLIIKKFGGTSSANPARIKIIALIIGEAYKKGEQVIVVISAQAGITDKIYSDANSLAENYSCEYDQALAAGEQINAALLALALNELGFKARAYNAWNLPIYGEGEYGNGFITEINSVTLKNDLAQGIIPVIAGFQAIKKNENNYITLGRGGSDYTAVMVAAAMFADACQIYTDVDGVYSADPNLVPQAIKIDKLSYEEAIKITSAGAKVLQAKSVIAAQKYNIYLEVISSFNNNIGTIIANDILIDRVDNNLKIITSNQDEISIIFLNKNEDLEECIDRIIITLFNSLSLRGALEGRSGNPIRAELIDPHATKVPCDDKTAISYFLRLESNKIIIKLNPQINDKIKEIIKKLHQYLNEPKE